MIIMGIDPGIARVGWAITSVVEPKIQAVAYGCIETKPTVDTAERLLSIHHNLNTLFETYHPDCTAIEELFFATNAKTAITVGQARGTILLTAALAHIPVVSYTPLSVKRTVTGDGHADKRQMQQMVTRLLHLTAIPKPDDAADALAIALAHAYSYKLKSKMT